MTINLFTGKLDERTERLFVSDEYKIFLLTGQDDGSGRKAFISAKPFHTLQDKTVAHMRSQANPLDNNSRISILANAHTLSLMDDATGTTSAFPISQLNEDVQRRLTTSLSNSWEKYMGKAGFEEGIEQAIPVDSKGLKLQPRTRK